MRLINLEKKKESETRRREGEKNEGKTSGEIFAELACVWKRSKEKKNQN